MALRVGIIGLGKIGRACASNLIADGFPVCALSRPSTADFVDHGGHLYSNTAELSAACDVIITCLASEAQMNDAYSGPEGLIAHTRAGQTVVEMGTFPAALKKPLADALAANGVRMLDCPISGIPARQIRHPRQHRVTQQDGLARGTGGSRSEPSDHQPGRPSRRPHRYGAGRAVPGVGRGVLYLGTGSVRRWRRDGDGSGLVFKSRPRSIHVLIE